LDDVVLGKKKGHYKVKGKTVKLGGGGEKKDNLPKSKGKSGQSRGILNTGKGWAMSHSSREIALPVFNQKYKGRDSQNVK